MARLLAEQARRDLIAIFNRYTLLAAVAHWNGRAKMSSVQVENKKTIDTAVRSLSGAKVSPSYMAHVVLRTTQKSVLMHWYSTVLGAEPVFDSDIVSFMTFDQEHHRLAIADVEFEGKEVEGMATVDHIAYSMASLEDLLNTYVRLKAEGILPVWPINHGPSISLYYRDPDGNHIELQADTFPTLAECKEYIAQSSEFRADPIGVEFEPDALVDAYETGMPLIEIFKRGTLPPPKIEPSRTFGPACRTRLLTMQG